MRMCNGVSEDSHSREARGTATATHSADLSMSKGESGEKEEPALRPGSVGRASSPSLEHSFLRISLSLLFPCQEPEWQELCRHLPVPSQASVQVVR